jgi:hypothetical protein
MLDPRLNLLIVTILMSVVHVGALSLCTRCELGKLSVTLRDHLDEVLLAAVVNGGILLETLFS